MFTAAPLPVKDKIVLGASGGDGGVRDFIVAVDAATGRLAWRKYVIPAPGEPGSETCKDTHNAWQTGGGAMWVTGSYDVETNQVLWGTVNPVPWSDPYYRPGDNLFTASLISWDRLQHGNPRFSLFGKRSRAGGDMSDANSDAPEVRIIPPLIYFSGIIVGLLVSIEMPTKVIPNPLAWAIGGILILCGAALAGFAILRFKGVGTTVRPDRGASSLVVAGPYKFTRNPMYLGLAVVYLGITVTDQSLWALILLPIVLTIIQRRAIEPEEAFLERRFGADYTSYKARVSRWL